jgi:hypothetical protein
MDKFEEKEFKYAQETSELIEHWQFTNLEK